jgi:hypothetical protein
MAVGRKTVAPRQTIQSQWGNWVWDQSAQSFIDRADRLAQFPNPLKGAVTTLDTWPGVLHIWDGTGWLATLHGYTVATTTADGVIAISWGHTFQSAPHVITQGEATSGQTGQNFVASPIPSLVTTTDATIIFRYIRYPSEINLVLGGVMGCTWSATGYS